MAISKEPTNHVRTWNLNQALWDREEEEKIMSEAIGKKDSKNKVRLDLVPTEAIEGLALALMDGIKKYDENNWRLGLSYSEIYGAAQRHLQKFWNTDKPDVDSESKLPHLYHAICNIAFLITYEENKERYRTFDDRVKNPPHVSEGE